MCNIEVTYEEVITDIKAARSDGRITEQEYQKLVGALIKSKFRNNPDPRMDLNPIIVKILGEEYNDDPIKDTEETNYEEN